MGGGYIPKAGLADDLLRVEELEAALPSMTQWRAPARRSVDRAALEADLGTALPSDYRSFAEAYPMLVIDEFLLLSVPRPGAEASWASGAVEFLTGVYGRTIDVPGMPRAFPSDDPKVLGMSDRID